MSGNYASAEHDAKLRVIAKGRHADPINTWPPHEDRHRRTLMGSRLYDCECLRCHFEAVSAEALKK